MVDRDLEKFCILQGSTLGEAARCMDKSRIGIILIVDDERRLVGTVTDGDLRRAMLGRIDLNESVEVLLVKKKGSSYARPVTASLHADPGVHLRLLQEHHLFHLPLLDDDQRVVGLITLDEFLPQVEAPMQAVIMAGGRGTRLYPLTEHVPKPMLPVGDRPLMEIIIEQLKEAGVKQVQITTCHKAEKIEEHFGDGRNFGVQLSYVPEEEPLGTAGGLGLLDPPKETTLVINGDILTQLNFQAMLMFHRMHRAILTMAVRRYDFQVPFGVIECEGPYVQGLSEKPSFNFFVNAGIYLLEPEVYAYISKGQRCDMTDLIQRLLDGKRQVVSFPIREYWLDIGQPGDYELAQQHAEGWKTSP